MPVYKYSAIAFDGSRKQGTLETASVAQLSHHLTTEGLFLVDHKIISEKIKSKKIKISEIADFCRQLAAMLASGITLIRAMQIIAQRDNKPEVKQSYTSLIEDLKRGNTLSDAMENQGKAYPSLLVNMIRSGESSGGLEAACAKMADTYDKQNKLSNKMKSASTYPLILIVMIISVIIVLFTFVMPKFEPLFRDMVLPLPTQIMFGISGFLVSYWYYVAVAVILGAALITSILKQPAPKHAIDRLKLRLPLIGKLMRTIYTARFARTLASLYVSGIPMIQSLTIARTTIDNVYIERQFDAVINALGNGMTLSQALMFVDGFDLKLQSTVMIGEESGRLEQMLDSVADQFDYEAEQATQRLVTLMEPVMIIIMAAVVALVIMSVILPIFQMYQNIG